MRSADIIFVFRDSLLCVCGHVGLSVISSLIWLFKADCLLLMRIRQKKKSDADRTQQESAVFRRLVINDSTYLLN